MFLRKMWLLKREGIRGAAEKFGCAEGKQGGGEEEGQILQSVWRETRQRMLSLLAQREMCVCELTTALEMTQPTTSHHLKIVRTPALFRVLRMAHGYFIASRISLGFPRC